MGFFKRLITRTQTPGPTAQAQRQSAPSAPLPARGTVASYRVTDAVGVLELESGEQVRFGRSACRDFEPVVGVRVILREGADGPVGWRAQAVDLDPTDTTYDARLADLYRQSGLGDRFSPVEQAAAEARQLGLLTILLKDPLPEGTVALAEWAAKRGFPRAGISATVARDLGFSAGGAPLLTYIGRGPIGREGLDLGGLPEDFDLGRSFICVGGGLPEIDRWARATMGRRAPDPWGVNGSLRVASRLAVLLAEGAAGFVLHRAGQRVEAVERFVGMLGNPEDPQCLPFAAWLGVGLISGQEPPLCGTWGMEAAGLPDVHAPFDAARPPTRTRAFEAVLYACYRMVRENRVLAPGEALRVPLGARIGAWPLRVDEEAPALSYSVAADGNDLRLTLVDEPDLPGAWRERGEHVDLAAYQALFTSRLGALVASTRVDAFPSSAPDVVPHTVEVRARDDGRGFLLVTNGFGRIAQRHADARDFAHVELAIWAPSNKLDLVHLVGNLGALMHSPDGDTWKAGDTLLAPIERLGIGGFVLADGGVVDMGGGPTVHLLLVVPVTPDEYAGVCQGRAAAWLSRTVIDERRWEPFLAAR